MPIHTPTSVLRATIATKIAKKLPRTTRSASDDAGRPGMTSRDRVPEAVDKKATAADYPYSFDIDDEEPLSHRRGNRRRRRTICPTTSRTVTSRSSRRATRTSPNCKRCRWPN